MRSSKEFKLSFFVCLELFEVQRGQRSKCVKLPLVCIVTSRQVWWSHLIGGPLGAPLTQLRPGTMEGSTVSDFSIERILSPQLGRRAPVKDFSPGRFLQGVAAGGLCPGPGSLRPPAPVPVPVPVPASGCLQFGGMSFGDTFYCGSGFSRFYPDSGVLVHFSSRESGGETVSLVLNFVSYETEHFTLFSSCWIKSDFLLLLTVDAQPLPGYHGHPHSSVPAQPQPPRQKARMRTVFTDTQTKHLEALFGITDYPAVEARAEVARSTGLSEETIRVSVARACGRHFEGFFFYLEI